MNLLNVEDFEKAFDEPMPVNGNVLVEIIQKDSTRTTKGGIIVQEESMGVVNPYLLVKAIALDVELKDLVVDDIVQISTSRINHFIGKDMRAFGLIASKDISAVHKHIEGKKVKITKPEVKEESKIIGGKGKIIIDN
jgi:hypothetical protein